MSDDVIDVTVRELRAALASLNKIIDRAAGYGVSVTVHGNRVSLHGEREKVTGYVGKSVGADT